MISQIQPMLRLAFVPIRKLGYQLAEIYCARMV